MSRLDTLIKELCPDGVEYKKLGEVATIFRGGNFQKKDYTETGVPCIHYGQIYTQYDLFIEETISFISDEKANKQKFAEPGDIIMAVTSENIDDVCKCIAWLGKEKVAISGHTAIIKHSLNPKYLSYYFHSSMFQRDKRKLAHGTKVMEVTPDHLNSVMLPVPPLEIQDEIVKVLDKFTDYVTELQAELQARKQQYEYYFKYVLDMFNSPKVRLGEIGSVKMCKRILKSQTSTDGDIPFYKIGTFGRQADSFISKELYEEYKAKYSHPRTGDVLISCSGTIGRTVVYDGIPAYFQDSNIVWLEHDNTRVSNEYLRYAYKTDPWIISTGGTISRLYNDGVLKAEVPLPTLEQQKQIVEILDRFDKLCNDISEGLPAEIDARQKQYEYYRDKLLTFNELEVK